MASLAACCNVVVVGNLYPSLASDSVRELRCFVKDNDHTQHILINKNLF